MLTKSLSVFVLLAVSVSSHALTLDTIDRGWYDNTGFHNPSNDNYFTGTHHYYPDVDVRSFYAFDLAGVSGVVISAQLQIFNTQTNGYEGPNPSEELKIFDVSTSVEALALGGSGLTSIYDDLGTGILFGTKTVGVYDQASLVSINLNQQAITSLNANLGGQFGLSAMLDTGLNGSKIFGGTFTGNPSDGHTRLILEISPIPEPETYSMLLAGLGLIAFRVWKRA